MMAKKTSFADLLNWEKPRFFSRTRILWLNERFQKTTYMKKAKRREQE